MKEKFDCAPGNILSFILRAHGTPLKNNNYQMKQLNKTSLALLILGTLLMSLSFIIKRYASLSDGAIGFIKGISIGLLIVSLIISSKQKKQQHQP